MLLPAACTVLAAAAQAQSGTACDQVKETLAARIEATGVRGYSLDVVPANEPAPPGTKSIGTCAGGASKVLYRRFALTAAPAASAAPTPAPPPAVAASKVVVSPAPAPVQVAASPPPPAPAPAPAPPPAAAPEAAEPASAGASEAAPASASASASASAPATEPLATVAAVPFSRLAADFALQNWQWLWLVLLLPVAGWAWQSRRSGYDEAGLPRGPKL